MFSMPDYEQTFSTPALSPLWRNVAAVSKEHKQLYPPVEEQMTIWIVMVIIGWGALLTLAGSSKTRCRVRQSQQARVANMFFYVPLLNMIGIAAPSLLLGADEARALKSQGKGFWLSRLRLSCLGYLFSLPVLPIAFLALTYR
jgi:hypothetical protein